MNGVKPLQQRVCRLAGCCRKSSLPFLSHLQPNRRPYFCSCTENGKIRVAWRWLQSPVGHLHHHYHHLHHPWRLLSHPLHQRPQQIISAASDFMSAFCSFNENTLPSIKITLGTKSALILPLLYVQGPRNFFAKTSSQATHLPLYCHLADHNYLCVLFGCSRYIYRQWRWAILKYFSITELICLASFSPSIPPPSPPLES